MGENHIFKDHSKYNLSRKDINELLLDKYKGESDRLNTFKGWKYMFISPEKLAKSGFINTGREDNVQCVFCAGILGNWEEKDDPMVEHKKLKCCFIQNNGYNVGNIPIVKQNPEISTSDMEILDDNDELPDQVNNVENLNDSDEDEKYQCDVCKENFELEENLTNHRMLHNASSRWKYSCTFCQNRFQHESRLKKHIFENHHGCYVCEIDFSSRLMLESHYKNSRRKIICA